MDRGWALTLHKCYFCIIIWAFTPEGLPYIKDETHELEIERDTEEAHKLRKIKKSPSQAGQLQTNYTNSRNSWEKNTKEVTQKI